MSDKVENKPSSKYDKKALTRIGILAVLFLLFGACFEWSYHYYMNNTIRFPWGTRVLTVDPESLNLLPNEQMNYLGTRADEDSETEFLYHANNMYLTAASAFSIRSGPGVYYQSIGRMYYGREVHVIATCDDNDWYMIEFYGEEAYVHSACLFEKLPELRPQDDETEFIIQGTRSTDALDTLNDDDETDETQVTEETEASAADTEPTEVQATPTPTPVPTAAPTATPAPTQAPSVTTPTDPVMLELFNLVNNERQNQGLPPLTWNSALASDAAVRAQEIAVVFSHTRPDGSEWWTVDPDRMYGENLASGQSTAQEAFNSWMASPGHRANILGDYSSCGFALYYGGDAGSTYYWVQEFGY